MRLYQLETEWIVKEPLKLSKPDAKILNDAEFSNETYRYRIETAYILVVIAFSEDGEKIIVVTVYRCEKCGEEYLELGNIEQLHNLIASMLIKKDSTLTGKEIRFLRKNLGYSAAVFAKLVGYENEHLSRIENGKNVCSRKTS